MGLQIDWYNQIINITSPTTNIDLQVAHDFIEDAMATPRGCAESDIIQPEGKIEDPNNPGVFSQIIIVLNSPWQFQFWAGSGYTRIYGGKLVGGLSDQPMKATGTAGDITVLESPVDGLTVVTGSGVTSQDKTDIIDGIWTHADGAALVANDAYRQKVIKNRKVIVKDGSTWKLIIYDDDNSTPILSKALKDKDISEIDDMVAGVLCMEMPNSV